MLVVIVLNLANIGKEKQINLEKNFLVCRKKNWKQIPSHVISQKKQLLPTIKKGIPKPKNIYKDFEQNGPCETF